MLVAGCPRMGKRYCCESASRNQSSQALYWPRIKTGKACDCFLDALSQQQRNLQCFFVLVGAIGRCFWWYANLHESLEVFQRGMVWLFRSCPRGAAIQRCQYRRTSMSEYSARKKKRKGRKSKLFSVSNGWHGFHMSEGEMRDAATKAFKLSPFIAWAPSKPMTMLSLNQQLPPVLILGRDHVARLCFPRGSFKTKFCIYTNFNLIVKICKIDKFCIYTKFVFNYIVKK